MQKSFIAIRQLLSLFSIALEPDYIYKALKYPFFETRGVGFFDDGVAYLKKKPDF
jgi:hypothetical protein